jgi:parvulin-like peptidyl-prolyl isomerase
LPQNGDATETQREEARRMAKAHIDQARADLQNGMSFADAAKKYSHASNAAEGGSWGFISPESVQERFAPAVARLQTLGPGQISEVIEGADSFFLVKCDQFDPGSEPDFQSVQPVLRDQLFARTYNQTIAGEVTQMRKNARFEPENLDTFHAAVVAAARSAAERLKSAP